MKKEYKTPECLAERLCIEYRFLASGDAPKGSTETFEEEEIDLEL